jgi:hypothetical protein
MHQNDRRRLVAPDLEPTPRLLEEIGRRAATLIRTSTERRYRQAVAAWAADDERDLPRREDVEAEVLAELEHLCRGLGTWAAVPPEDLWGPELRFDPYELGG